MSVGSLIEARVAAMTGPLKRLRDGAAFNAQCRWEHVLIAELHLAADPDERVALLFNLSDVYGELSRTCDMADLFPLKPGEGASHHQVYNDMAVLAFDLAGSEMCLLCTRTPEEFVPRAADSEERKAWEALHTTWDRAVRAEVLCGDLASRVTRRCGTRAGSVLIMAAGVERWLAGD